MAKKKTLLIIPIVIIMTIIISAITPICAYAEDDNYEPRLTAPSTSNPYYSRTLNVYAQTGTPMPNCVAYAYGRVYEMNEKAPLIKHGSAGDWYFTNKSHNYYEYGNEPKVGAVACWSRHVAVVEKINDNGSVTLSESHWGGNYFNTVTYSNMYSHYGQTFYGYIYTYDGDKIPDFVDVEPEPISFEKLNLYGNINQFNIFDNTPAHTTADDLLTLNL